MANTRSDRCVDCGRSKDLHGPDLKCPVSDQGHFSNGYFATMNLPEGKTCGDCRFFSHCAVMVGAEAANERCDWYPVRFVGRV
jgi:hypothetical protein